MASGLLLRYAGRQFILRTAQDLSGGIDIDKDLNCRRNAEPFCSFGVKRLYSAIWNRRLKAFFRRVGQCLDACGVIDFGRGDAVRTFCDGRSRFARCLQKLRQCLGLGRRFDARMEPSNQSSGAGFDDKQGRVRFKIDRLCE